MSTKIYVGNLPWRATDAQLTEMFAIHGDVIEARIINDRETGRSRGFGFVTMSAGDAAQNAIRALNGTSLEGRALVVNEAREQQGGAGGGAGRGDAPRPRHAAPGLVREWAARARRNPAHSAEKITGALDIALAMSEYQATRASAAEKAGQA
jgi:RNA recognition motif-containing protein